MFQKARGKQMLQNQPESLKKIALESSLLRHRSMKMRSGCYNIIYKDR